MTHAGRPRNHKRRNHERADVPGVIGGGRLPARIAGRRRGAVRTGRRPGVRLRAGQSRGPGRGPGLSLGHRVEHGGRRPPVCDRHSRPHLAAGLPHRELGAAARRGAVRRLPRSRHQRLPAARARPASRGRRGAHPVRGAPRRPRVGGGLRDRRARRSAGRHLGGLRGRARGRRPELGLGAPGRRLRRHQLPALDRRAVGVAAGHGMDGGAGQRDGRPERHRGVAPTAAGSTSAAGARSR